MALFWEKLVKPYLKFDSVVEIDETKVSTERGHARIAHPVYRWVLGIYDRKTKLTLMHYIKNRRSENILPLLK